MVVAECISNSSPMNPVIGLILAVLIFVGATEWSIRAWERYNSRKLLGRNRRG